MCLACFVLLKVFLILFYLSVSTPLREKVYSSWHNRVLKYLKPAIFLSVLSWIKKVQLKNMVWRGRVKRKFLLEGRLNFNRGARNISKKGGAWQESGGEKIEKGVCDSQRNFEELGIATLLCFDIVFARGIFLNT